jgi:hypothetical protein
MIDHTYLMLIDLLINWQVSAVLRLVGPGHDRPYVPDAD